MSSPERNDAQLPDDLVDAALELAGWGPISVEWNVLAELIAAGEELAVAAAQHWDAGPTEKALERWGAALAAIRRVVG